jgi:CBS domain-containing protein
MDLPYKSPEQLLPYRTLKQILAEKAPGVYSVAPNMSVFSALQLMAEKDIGAVAVLEGQKLVGIFSERDYARKVVLTGKTSKDTPVREVMTENVIVVTPAHTVPQSMELMTSKRIRHLPVVEDDRVIGILSIGDLLKEMLAHHERLIRQLETDMTVLTTPDPSSY